MDIINEYERMGDFMINVSQDLERAYIHNWYKVDWYMLKHRS
jgi:hypothetical protein